MLPCSLALPSCCPTRGKCPPEVSNIPIKRQQGQAASASFSLDNDRWELRFHLPASSQCRRGVREGRRVLVLRAAAVQLGDRNFHAASGPLRSKHVVNCPTELIRDKFSNYVHAVVGFARRYDQGSLGLFPSENQLTARVPVEG